MSHGLILFAVLPIVTITQSPTLSAESIYKKWSPSVVRVEAGDSIGTGFFDSEGRLFTAYHVVKGAIAAKIRFADGKVVSAYWYKHVDPGRDFAILETEYYDGWEKREYGPKLGDYAALSVGEKVTVIGSPLGLDGSITEGLVSAKRQSAGTSYLQLSASISKGSSGSPVFNQKGEVIGLVTSFLKEGQNLNFAIGSRDLKVTDGIPMQYVRIEDSLPSAPPSSTSVVGMMLRPKLIPQSSITKPYELEGLDAIRILIEDLPDALKDEFSSSSVESWVRQGLGSSRIRLMTSEEHSALYSQIQTTEADALRNADKRLSLLYVNINALKDSVGRITYALKVEIKRGVFMYPGRFAPATVWTTGTTGYFGGGNRASTVLRDSVTEQVKAFVDDWSLVNQTGTSIVTSPPEAIGVGKAMKHEQVTAWEGGRSVTSMGSQSNFETVELRSSLSTVGSTSSFLHTLDSIFIVYAISPSSTGRDGKVEIYAEPTTTQRGERLVESFTFQILPGTSKGNLQFAKPADGWHRGNYRLELSLGGRVNETLWFWFGDKA